MATGGEAVAHLEDGRVVFIEGAVPDETVRIELVQEKKRFARGKVVAVLEPGSDRTPLTCDHALSRECGGCDWLFVTPAAQRRFKTTIVVEQLQRLGGVDVPSVTHHPAVPGRRTAIRAAVSGDRAGFRARRSDQRFVAESCQALHPELEQLLIGGRFPGCDEVTLRIGIGTAQRLALAHATGDGDLDVDRLELPEDVIRCEPGDGAAIETDVAGERWRVSADAFFQTSDTGAEALVAAVRSALEGSEGRLIDLYAGGGLLGGAAAPERLDTAVESHPAAARDARHNLGRLAPEARVVEARVEQWTADRAYGTVIADPARSGLGARGVATVETCQASHLVLVSCDPAALGRDTAALREHGWAHGSSTVIDMFADTSQIEVVSVFRR